MSKYLFYVAFLYFCYYAGNKAFPSTATPLTTQVKTITAADSAKAQSTHLMQALPNAQPATQPHPLSSGIKTEISKAITASHILIIAMPGSIAGNFTPAQDSIIRQAATRSLALLNEVSK